MNSTVTSEAPSHLDILSGTSYRARHRLGEGSMGLVVEAEHRTLGSLVVVKLLHQALAQRADFVDRMRVEAQSLARLRHPNLVAVTDFAVTPAGIPFLVMERLSGHTLADECARRGALPLEEAIDIAQQTLAGLGAAHEAGIIHRDIKAANLFLCDGPAGRRTVKLLDFGIAKVLASAPSGRAPQPLRYPTAEGTTVGTPRCLSPEQARGGPVDARTDVYAAGVFLYSLLVGAGPFDHIGSQMELLHAHVSVAPIPPSHRATQPIPPGIEAAVMRALAKRPADRFASAAEFSAALARASTWASNRFDTTPAPSRFDTEPLSSSADAACEPTLWPVVDLGERVTSLAPVPLRMRRFDTISLLPELRDPSAVRALAGYRLVGKESPWAVRSQPARSATAPTTQKTSTRLATPVSTPAVTLPETEARAVRRPGAPRRAASARVVLLVLFMGLWIGAWRDLSPFRATNLRPIARAR